MNTDQAYVTRSERPNLHGRLAVSGSGLSRERDHTGSVAAGLIRFARDFVSRLRIAITFSI